MMIFELPALKVYPVMWLLLLQSNIPQLAEGMETSPRTVNNSIYQSVFRLLNFARTKSY